ncbi:hypothetical protein OG976_06630 [Mycobacterium sp. NBC_00419]|uniref:hypothetical protein n=1 Tax=Mycobacterium sp. NBC_00419 TaxID=2975989 RepID=UPI002E1EA870
MSAAMNRFPYLRVGVAVLAAAGLAGCSPSGGRPTAETASSTPSTVAATTATTATSAAGSAAEGGVTDVPWPQVGPGWVLAQWSASQDAGATLYLVDPAAHRYAITTFEPGANVELVDWSGDGSHALFAAAAVTPSSAISVDLHTGAQSTVALSGFPRYTRPDGLALLVSTHFNGSKPGTLKRVDLQGNPQLTYPTEDLGGAGQFSGEYAASPDGTQLVLGTANLGNELVPRTDNSLVVLGNDGTVIRRLAAPMPEAMCAPVKWWTPQTLLAQCVAEKGSANQLWEVPLDGGAPTALTAVNSARGDDPAFGGDLGDVDAWKLPSGVFLQSLGAGCDQFLSRLASDGHATRVKVPDVAAGAAVTGAANGHLVLRDQKNCRGTTSLVSFDPARNTATVLLGPPVNGGSVSQSMLYPSADS